jgi:hypothetical protein
MTATATGAVRRHAADDLDGVTSVSDVVYIVLTLASFALLVVLVRGLEKL